jgi:hypothetical protein
VIGGTNRDPPDPTIRSEIRFGLENNYLPEPEHPLLGTPFAMPVDGTEPSTDQFIVISGPAISAGFFDEVDAGAFRATSRVWLRPAPDSAGVDGTVVLPIDHLALPADGAASQRSLRLLPVDLFGNIADPNAGFAIDLVATGGARIVSPNLDDDPNSEGVVLASAAGMDIVIDDATQTAGEGRIDLLQGLRVLGSLPVTLSSAPDSDADGIRDDFDSCRLVFNPSQEDGDQNGLGNCCDGGCVTDPNGEGCVECACPQLGGDSDGDGICSDADPCPLWQNALPLVDTNGDSIPDDCQCGDSNGNGLVTSSDARIIYQCSTGSLSEEQCPLDLLDVNNSGRLTSTDLRWVNQAVVGIRQTWELRCPRRPSGTPPPDLAPACELPGVSCQ